MTKTVLNVDICQVAWFLCFTSSLFSTSSMSGFQIWDRIRDISSGNYNPDGDLLVSSVNSQIGNQIRPTNNPYNLLRVLNGTHVVKNTPPGQGLMNSTQETLNFNESGTIQIGNEKIEFRITERWAKIDTYHLHSIAICGLLGTISACLATLNAVFNVKSRAFMCLQQIWIFFGFVFQLMTMCMVVKYSRSMAGICPYDSYRIIGWISVISEGLGLILYIVLDPSCFSLCRRTVYVRTPGRNYPEEEC